ncbi:uncharacterized protein LOC142343845 [Convolutriloba macropyga]|uniref:uncharacterized protein LOC142343845 n=1 Tax=Convolutriloba macropyga TaxID=536237 RepID=UPI003F528369
MPSNTGAGNGATTPLRRTIPALNMRMKTFKRSSARIHQSLTSCRSGKPLHRYSGCQRSSNLELLRKALQPSLNREMRRLLEEYQELFTMANDNIRENIAREDNSSPQEYLLLATRIALDHARNALLADNSAVSNTNVFTTQGVNSNLVPQPQLVTTSQLQTHQNYSSAQNNMQRQAKKRPVVAAMDASRLLAVIDASEFESPPPGSTSLSSNSTNASQSETNQLSGRDVTTARSNISLGANGSSTADEGGSRTSAPLQWKLSRINPQTMFTLGSRANRALGLGTTRGRLYIKHPEIFKYPADQADKQWLAEVR